MQVFRCPELEHLPPFVSVDEAHGIIAIHPGLTHDEAVAEIRHLLPEALPDAVEHWVEAVLPTAVEPLSMAVPLKPDVMALDGEVTESPAAAAPATPSTVVGDRQQPGLRRLALRAGVVVAAAAGALVLPGLLATPPQMAPPPDPDSPPAVVHKPVEGKPVDAVVVEFEQAEQDETREVAQVDQPAPPRAPEPRPEAPRPAPTYATSDPEPSQPPQTAKPEPEPTPSPSPSPSPPVDVDLDPEELCLKVGLPATASLGACLHRAGKLGLDVDLGLL